MVFQRVQPSLNLEVPTTSVEEDTDKVCLLLGINVNKNAFNKVKNDIGCGHMSYDYYNHQLDLIQNDPNHILKDAVFHSK